MRNSERKSDLYSLAEWFALLNDTQIFIELSGADYEYCYPRNGWISPAELVRGFADMFNNMTLLPNGYVVVSLLPSDGAMVTVHVTQASEAVGLTKNGNQNWSRVGNRLFALSPVRNTWLARGLGQLGGVATTKTTHVAPTVTESHSDPVRRTVTHWHTDEVTRREYSLLWAADVLRECADALDYCEAAGYATLNARTVFEEFWFTAITENRYIDVFEDVGQGELSTLPIPESNWRLGNDDLARMLTRRTEAGETYDVRFSMRRER